MVFRYWSFELTATVWPTPERRAKLVNRKIAHAEKLRVDRRIQSLREHVKQMAVVKTWRDYTDAQKAEKCAA
jgi:hypothetical protein